MNTSKVVVKVLGTMFSLFLVVVIAFLLFRLGQFSYDIGYRVFTEPPVEDEPGQDVLVEVKKDMSPFRIGDILEEKGLIESRNLFVLQMIFSAHTNKIKTGLYTLNTSQTAMEMLTIMAAEKLPEELEEEAESADDD
jgi:UPF0755 protein